MRQGWTTLPVALAVVILGWICHSLAEVGANAYVTVKDGKLWLNGQRVRFWGAVVSGPNRSHADNEAMAERIGQLGFNMVRYWRGYADLAEYKKGDGSKTDLIDHFLWCLKRRGIYVWMAGAFNNLGQATVEDVNIIDEPKTAEQWKQAVGKGVPLRNNLARIWDKRLEAIAIERMKAAADHLNQWTEMRWGDDPVFAVWELSNEEWWFRKMWRGQFANLHPFFIRELLEQWNEFLTQRYGNDDALRSAWGFLLPFESLDKKTVLLLPVGNPLSPNPQLEALNLPTPKVEEVKKLALNPGKGKEYGEPTKLEVELELREGQELAFLPSFEGSGLCAATFRFEGLKVQMLPEGPTYQPPEEWRGKELGKTDGNPYLVDGKPIWRFDRIWPDDPMKPENYQPMVWTAFAGKLERWGVPMGQPGEQGGQPCGFVIAPMRIVCLEPRTPWPGNPGYKLGALVFIAPKAGKYRIEAIVTVRVWEGGGPKLVVRLLKIDKAAMAGLKARYSLDDFTAQRGRDVVEFLVRIWIAHKQREANEVKKCGKSLALAPLVWDTGIGMELQSQFMQQHGDAIAHCTYMHGFVTDPMHRRFPWFSGLEEPPIVSRDAPWPEHARHPNKPFFLYENQIEQPAKYRAEWPYRIVALGSIQDWDVIVWHITGFDQHPIAGVERPFDRKMDYSASFNPHPQGLHFRYDEVQQSAMTAAGYIFRNFSLKPAPNPTIFIFGRKSLYDPRMADLYPLEIWRKWTPTTFRYGARWLIDPNREDDEIIGPTVRSREFLPCPLKPTDEITYDWHKGYLMFDAPGVAMFVGFFAQYGNEVRFKNGVILQDVQIVNPPDMPYPVAEDEKYVAFCLTSADGLPLGETKRVILSIVSTSFNSGFKLNHEALKREWIWSANPGATISTGKEPVLVARVSATVRAPMLNGMHYRMLDWHMNEVAKGTIKDGTIKITADLPVFIAELSR